MMCQRLTETVSNRNTDDVVWKSQNPEIETFSIVPYLLVQETIKLRLTEAQ